MSNIELSEQELVRRGSLQKLRELGINPYPANEFKINITANQIITTFNPEIPNLQEVVFAGRLMSQRIMGKASFGELQDDPDGFRSMSHATKSAPARIKHFTMRYLKNCWISGISLA
jgi:lysyl-tRNA synthetase class II